MADSQDGMATQHSRAGVAHDLTNALSHLDFIAVNSALGARTLRLRVKMTGGVKYRTCS
jgi:hypothetical protein